MRKLKKEELNILTNFIFDNSFEKIQAEKTFSGIDMEKSNQLAIDLLSIDLQYFFKYGDIFIFDDDITGALVGIEFKQISLLKDLPFALKSNKVLKKLSREELNIIKQNVKIVRELNNKNWSKKYCKNPYYFIQFGIDMKCQETDIIDKMFKFLFEYVRKYNNVIVLETLSLSNVELYKKFGFEVMETLESSNKELKQYRMLKRL